MHYVLCLPVTDFLLGDMEALRLPGARVEGPLVVSPSLNPTLLWLVPPSGVFSWSPPLVTTFLACRTFWKSISVCGSVSLFSNTVRGVISTLPNPDEAFT